MSKKKVVYETFRFRQTMQFEGESNDTFYIKLHKLAQHFDFPDKDCEILTQIFHGCPLLRRNQPDLRKCQRNLMTYYGQQNDDIHYKLYAFVINLLIHFSHCQLVR